MSPCNYRVKQALCICALRSRFNGFLSENRRSANDLPASPSPARRPLFAGSPAAGPPCSVTREIFFKAVLYFVVHVYDGR